MKRQLITLASALVLASASQIALAGDAAAGKAKSAVCAGCHGANGISNVPTYPNLAGQKEQYLISAMKGFRDGSRTGGQSQIMYPMAKPLSDADIANLAAYYASLK